MNRHYSVTVQTFYVIIDGLKFGSSFVTARSYSFRNERTFGLEQSSKIIPIYSIKFNKHLLSAMLFITMLLLSKLCLRFLLSLEIVFKSQAYSSFNHLYYSSVVEIKLSNGIEISLKRY